MARKTFNSQRFQFAVRTIAFLRAKKVIQVQIKARGEKISNYSCREMSAMAEAYMTQHREELIAKATADVARFPDFSPFVCAYVRTDAQSQSPPKSITSTVQISGAK